MNKEQARSFFPYLDNGIIYFNHAATGPVSKLVKDRISNLLDEKSNNNFDDYEAFLNVASETKELLAKLLNCEADRIAFVDNTTNGLNILAQSMHWEKGDRILLNDVEFPANVYPYLNLKQKGVEIDFVKSINGIVTAEQIIDSIKPQTKLVSVSFVQFLSGYKIDLKKIGSYCRKNNIVFCVDAIQGLGAVNLDVEESSIDFLSCGTQKWMLGLHGLGFIFIKESLQQKINPAFIGWLSVNDSWNLLDYKFALKSSADVFQGGTLNTFGIYALNSSLKLFTEFGFDKVETEVIKNSRYFIKRLLNSGFEPILKNCSESELSGIVTIKPENPELVLSKLLKRKIFCALREKYIRFSPHFYNTSQEIDAVVDELQNF